MPGKNGIPGTPGHHGHKGEKGEKGKLNVYHHESQMKCNIIIKIADCCTISPIKTQRNLIIFRANPNFIQICCRIL